MSKPVQKITEHIIIQKDRKFAVKYVFAKLCTGGAIFAIS